MQGNQLLPDNELTFNKMLVCGWLSEQLVVHVHWNYFVLLCFLRVRGFAGLRVCC